MPPHRERWVKWGRWYAVIAALGLLGGAIWALAVRPPERTESKVPVPGPTMTREVQSPPLPGEIRPGPTGPGRLLRPPQPSTKTVTVRPETTKTVKSDETGPGGRKEVRPSGSNANGGSTGSSPAGGADGESVAPSPEA